MADDRPALPFGSPAQLVLAALEAKGYSAYHTCPLEGGPHGTQLYFMGLWTEDQSTAFMLLAGADGTCELFASLASAPAPQAYLDLIAQIPGPYDPRS